MFGKQIPNITYSRAVHDTCHKTRLYNFERTCFTSITKVYKSVHVILYDSSYHLKKTFQIILHITSFWHLNLIFSVSYCKYAEYGIKHVNEIRHGEDRELSLKKTGTEIIKRVIKSAPRTNAPRKIWLSSGISIEKAAYDRPIYWFWFQSYDNQDKQSLNFQLSTLSR